MAQNTIGRGEEIYWNAKMENKNQVVAVAYMKKKVGITSFINKMTKRLTRSMIQYHENLADNHKIFFRNSN